ncbi:hypothetical protein [Roseibium aggregatum]|uniref:Lipoprotein n=1 Tax=Roseibium aggregatum TaxID=187304 RepID=A0A939EJC3_9HYPH|nr:hypothetical protein [Roseibium aggregatum]MBN9674074.1 hypothetical protein [Roseibium aggregatum]
MFPKQFNDCIFFGAVACVLAACQTAGGSSSRYEVLKSQGYKTGSLTQSASGSAGWYLSGDGKRIFCQARGGVTYVGETGMVILIPTSGRMLKVDREAYHKHQGVTKTDAAQLSDLKAGRLRPRDVGRCTFVSN